MISLNFKIENSFLAAYIIGSYNKKRFIPYAKEQYQKDIVAFQNMAWEESKDICMLIDGRYSIYKYGLAQNLTHQEIGSRIDSFLKKVVQSREFEKLKKQTENSKSSVINEWNDNYEKTSEYINSLGIKLDGEYEVNLVHPGLKAGNYLGNRLIIWCHQTYWPNYNTVYLWHEVLHSYFESNDNTHALIELITDEEMRKMLNGENYPPFVGHSYLEEIKYKVLDAWNDYLASENNDIARLINDIEDLA